jgi:cytochrome c2
MGYPYRIFRQNAWPLRLMICAPLILQTSPAFAQDSEDLDGGKLLQSNCGRCHAVEQTGNSPLQSAPPLRDIYRKRSTEQLEFEFAEGMGSRHPEMPQIQFSSEEIAAILTHLKRIINFK